MAAIRVRFTMHRLSYPRNSKSRKKEIQCQREAAVLQYLSRVHNAPALLCDVCNIQDVQDEVFENTVHEALGGGFNYSQDCRK